MEKAFPIFSMDQTESLLDKLSKAEAVSPDEIKQIFEAFSEEKAYCQEVLKRTWLKTPIDRNGVFIEDADTILIHDHDYCSLITGNEYVIHEAHGGTITYNDADHEHDPCDFLLETPGVNLLGVHIKSIVFEVTHRMGVPISELAPNEIVKLNIEQDPKMLFHFYNKEKS